ncbi:ABC-2 family transporter protein [Bartonella taylorii]|uniref:ABC-2 family transporter protein n=1 Tax=Bartonella taylorii TaxID=33046 RepID=UPI001ABAFB56|nr:ABC-2 family transporter protein [Bartonella taylorii]
MRLKPFLILKTVRLYLGCAKLFAFIAVKEILIDKYMLIIDLLLATSIPFITQYIIWHYIYTGNAEESVSGYNFQQLMFYFAISIAFWRLNNSYSVIEYFARNIQAGELEPRLLWPIPIPVQRFWDFLGGAIIYAWPIIIIVAVCFFLFEVETISPFYWFWTIIYIIETQILCYLIGLFMALSTFKFVRPDFLLALLSALQGILGGTMLPPSFWPETIAPIMFYNPFRFIIAAPAELIIDPNIGNLISYCLQLNLYMFVFIVLCAIYWKVVMTKYETAGG